MLYERKGAEIDKEHAYNYLTIIGFPNTKFIVGKMLYEGDYVTADTQKAIKFLRIAARKGVKDANQYISSITQNVENDDDNEDQFSDLAKIIIIIYNIMKKKYFTQHKFFGINTNSL